MHKYVIKRLLMMIPVLLCVAFVIYAIMNVAEGDPVYSVVSADATEAQIEAAREELGLNGTLLERYFRYVKGMLTGDLGTSYVSKRDVMQTYLERLPNTLKLASVTTWLIEIGALEVITTADGKNTKLPTERGTELGILTEKRMGQRGEYTVVVYNIEAQRFIIDNIEAIIAVNAAGKKSVSSEIIP